MPGRQKTRSSERDRSLRKTSQRRPAGASGLDAVENRSRVGTLRLHPGDGCRIERLHVAVVVGDFLSPEGLDDGFDGRHGRSGGEPTGASGSPLAAQPKDAASTAAPARIAFAKRMCRVPLFRLPHHTCVHQAATRAARCRHPRMCPLRIMRQLRRLSCTPRGPNAATHRSGGAFGRIQVRRAVICKKALPGCSGGAVCHPASSTARAITRPSWPATHGPDIP